MSTKEKKHKPRVKKPKPNLHGPNSPTPKKKVTSYQEDEESEERLYVNDNSDQ